jgi:Flp pilus assembly protein TadD
MSRTGHRSRTIASVARGERSASSDRSFWLICVGLGLAAALAAFWPALDGSFVFDDFHLPFADPHAAQMPAAFWIGGVRPLLSATYWLNFLISGTRPAGYHFVNLLLHVTTSVLVLLIFERLFRIAHQFSPAAADRREYALFGAAIFLLHPLQTESVDYIAGRSELIAGLFFCASWLVFLRNFDRDTTTAIVFKVLSLAGLAVLGKESAISLPFLLFLTDVYFSDRPIVKQLRRRIRLYSVLLMGGAAAAALILRTLVSGTAAGFSLGITPWQYALTQCRAILIYLRLFIVPVGQNIDWRVPFYRSLTDDGAVWYMIGILLLVGLVIRLFRKNRLISFGLAAFLIMLAPTSSIVPIQDAVAERRMYLPIAGLILALIGVAAKMRLSSLRWGAAAVILVFGLISHSRSGAWASDVSLWSASVHANPANERAHFGLGSAMLIHGDCSGAAREFKTLSDNNKNDDQAFWNLGTANDCLKRPAEALRAFRSFAMIRPTATAYDRIGMIEAKRGDAGAALAALEEALKLDPRDSVAYMYRGLVYESLNDRQGAISDLQHTLELDPQNQIAAQHIAALAAGR